MIILFGVLWLVVAIAIALLIQAKMLKSKSYYKVGLTLIILSFICGLSMLVAVISNI